MEKKDYNNFITKSNEELEIFAKRISKMLDDSSKDVNAHCVCSAPSIGCYQTSKESKNEINFKDA